MSHEKSAEYFFFISRIFKYKILKLDIVSLISQLFSEKLGKFKPWLDTRRSLIVLFQVWLADDNLLVLKGGLTDDRDGYDDIWEPLDDYEAPYREPVLPPPDFDPETLDLGVGVPIEDILLQRTANPLFNDPTERTITPVDELGAVKRRINNLLQPYKGWIYFMFLPDLLRSKKLYTYVSRG